MYRFFALGIKLLDVLPLLTQGTLIVAILIIGTLCHLVPAPLDLNIQTWHHTGTLCLGISAYLVLSLVCYYQQTLFSLHK